jgi:NADH:ubiquinone oxidoreductase subunit H
LVLAQAKFVELAGLQVPRWGLVAQPVGFALGFLLMALATPIERPGQPLLALLAMLGGFERLVWAALLVTLYLGGPIIPGLSQHQVAMPMMPMIAHGPQIALELLAFALKVAALAYLATLLRAHVSSLGVTDNHLLELHTRWTIPLALLNLAALLIWVAV